MLGTPVLCPEVLIFLPFFTKPSHCLARFCLQKEIEQLKMSCISPLFLLFLLTLTCPMYTNSAARRTKVDSLELKPTGEKMNPAAASGSGHGPNWDYNWGWGSGPGTGWGYGSGSGQSPTGYGRGFGYGFGVGTGSGSGSGYGSGSGGAHGGGYGHGSGSGSGGGGGGGTGTGRRSGNSCGHSSCSPGSSRGHK